MASYHFTWDHPASEVYVTGTFDNWAKTERLEQTGTRFQKTVSLPNSEDKILYKFVVDGQWTTDHTAPSERDQGGNINNVLTSDRIQRSQPSGSSFLSSAAPGTSSAALAGQQPLEREETQSSGLPGAFPETPMNENQQFSVNPLPATAGAGNPINLAPGEQVPHPSTFTDNTVSSTVRDDPSLGRSAADSEQTFGVSPLPATSGAGNPIQLAPGEKVPDPSTFTSNTLTSNVRLDKESYERGGTNSYVLPPVLSEQEQAEADGAGMFNMPTPGGTMIPESSLPMGGSTGAGARDAGPSISSVAPQSTTAQLAGQQPIQARGVPEVVSESEQSAGFSPEAASNPEAVQDKSQLEDELLSKVPEAPSTSESGGAGILSVAPQSTSTVLAGQQPIEPRGVPEVVSESNQRAGFPDEAADNSDAVAEKSQVEDELKQKIPEAPSTSESGIIGKSEKGYAGMAAGGLAAAGAAAVGGAYYAKDQLSGASETTSSRDVDPTSAAPVEASNAAIQDKLTVQDEIKETIPEAPTTSESGVIGKSEQGYAGLAAGGLAAAGATVAGGAYYARDQLSGATETSSNRDVDPTSAAPVEASNAVIQDKLTVQDEIKEKIPEAPTTSESGTFGKSENNTGIVETVQNSPSGVTGTTSDRDIDPTSAAPAEASSSAVQDKLTVQDEIKEKIPEAATTSESGTFGKSENTSGVAGAAAGGVAAAGAAVAGGAYLARDKAASATGSNPHTFLPPSVQSAIDNMNSGAGSSEYSDTTGATSTGYSDTIGATSTGYSDTTGTTSTGYSDATATQVPEEVRESQREAGVDPEASASPEAVQEKSAMENELQQKIQPTNETGAPAPTESAALSSTAPAATTSETAPLSSTAAIPTTSETAPLSSTAAVPATSETAPLSSTAAIPTNSETAQGVSPVSAADDVAATGSDNVSGLNAPAEAPAQTPATKNLEAPAAAPTSGYQSSRDVSPMSKPVATSGVESSTVPAKSQAAPAPVVPTGDSKAATTTQTKTPPKARPQSQVVKGTPESSRTTGTTGSPASAADGKAKKRQSFFGKLKEKLKS